MSTGGQRVDRVRILVLGVITLLVAGCSSDGGSGGGTAAVCQTNCPTAKAGPEQAVLMGAPVTLDGSGSTSGTPGLITYQWTLQSKPAGSAATLAGATTARPTFTADVAGTYAARLVVQEGEASSAPDTVTITCGTGNLAPIADAGPDRTELLGTLVMLDGTGSRDPNGTPITYAWRVVTQPSGSQAVLLSPTSRTPSFTPQVAGPYTLALTVGDGALTSPSEEVVITVTADNCPPIANAGADQQVPTGRVVTLSGAGSTDPNDDPLTYSWRFQSKPAGSTATVAAATSVSPTFTADMAGLYVLSLVVSDGTRTSAPDSVVVGSNTPPGSSPPQPTAQVGRFNAPVAAIIPVPNGNGDIYVAGLFTTYNNQPVRLVVRLRPNGTLNDTFALTDSVTGNVTAIAAADDGSGDLYVSEAWLGTARVWKVNSAGAIASGFTTGELRHINHPIDSPGSQVRVMASVGDGSGRIYLGGAFDTYNQTPVRHFVRLNTNGTIDPAFVPEESFGIWNILPADNGSGDLYVIPFYAFQGPGGLLRLNPDGTKDPAFSRFGLVESSPYTVTLAEDGSGDLFPVGGFAQRGPIFLPGFARLNADGSFDETSPRLNGDGSIDPTAPWSEVWYPNFVTKARDGTNDLFVVGDGIPDRPTPHLRRFKADGTLDPSFTAGQVSLSEMFVHCVSSSDCRGINLILPAPDNTGDVYVAGGFTTYNSVPVGHIVRLNRDGTLE